MNGKKAKAQRHLERNKALFGQQLGKVLHEEMLIESGQQSVPIKTMSLGGYKAALEKVTSGIGVVGTTPRIPDVVEDEWIMSEAQAKHLLNLGQVHAYDGKAHQVNSTEKHYFDIGVEANAVPKHEPLPLFIDIPYDHSVMERIVSERHENDDVSGISALGKVATKYPFKLTDMHGDRGVICRVDPILLEVHPAKQDKE